MESQTAPLFKCAIDIHNLLGAAISSKFAKESSHGSWSAVVTGLLGSQYAHHRAVLSLVDNEMARQAMPLVRTNFEAAIAVTWMCAPLSLRPLENGKPLASPSKPKTLSRTFRANCYIASRLHHSRRLFEETGQPSSIYQQTAVPEHITRQLRLVSGKIGADWMKRIDRKKSYSGLSFKDTCDSLSFLGYHNSTYRTHSLPVHAGDALDYATLLDDGSIQLSLDPSATSARSALGISSTMLLMSVINISRFKDKSLRQEANTLLKQLRSMS